MLIYRQPNNNAYTNEAVSHEDILVQMYCKIAADWLVLCDVVLCEALLQAAGTSKPITAVCGG